MGILEAEEGEDQAGEHLHHMIRTLKLILGGLGSGLGRLEELLQVMLWDGNRAATVALARVHGDRGLLVLQGRPRCPTQLRAPDSDLQDDAEATLFEHTKHVQVNT